MTQDERIKRLTELARKAYGNRQLGAAHGDWEGEHPGFEVIDDAETELYVCIKAHPRALDALEAALLALADETVCMVEVGHLKGIEERAEAAEEKLARLRRQYDELMSDTEAFCR